MDQLSYATSLNSLTGELARKLDQMLREHMVRESATVNPLLSSFVVLAQGKWPEDAVELSKRFSEAEASYEQLLSDHREILSLVNRLQAAAREEKEEEIVRFCEDLAVHAQLEEQVLYPAAVIAGRYMALWGKQRGDGGS